MTSNLTAILFDKDGTLIDYHKSWSSVNRAAAVMAACGDEELALDLLLVGGFDPSSGQISPDTLLAAGSTTEIAHAWTNAGSPMFADDLKDALDRLFQESVATSVPVTDLGALFVRLKKRGFKLGIASTDSELAVRATVTRFRLEMLVDFVAGYDSGFGTKPDAGMFRAFCSATGIRPADTIMVGDNVHDMAMAAAGGAGFKVGVLTGTGTRRSLSPHCDICIESIAGLEELLASNTNLGS
ncbi:HAD family hydrolase [Microvirga sp. 2MCAF38]|uniref:HAD family hydrolase n=1 Tax=Microvirga sp. 2MCAF38 TaxID=3232989 RepID=UPI003F9A7382